MKTFFLKIVGLSILVVVFLSASKPSIDGRAIVATDGEVPPGLYINAATFLPGDTVIITNPATKISIEVMVFGTFNAGEGFAAILSEDVARQLYITKGSNNIVQITKVGTNSEALALNRIENSILDMQETAPFSPPQLTANDRPALALLPAEPLAKKNEDALPPMDTKGVFPIQEDGLSPLSDSKNLPRNTTEVAKNPLTSLNEVDKLKDEELSSPWLDKTKVPTRKDEDIAEFNPLRNLAEVDKLEDKELSSPWLDTTKVPTSKDEDIAEFNPLRKVTEVVKIEEEESSTPLGNITKVPTRKDEDIAEFNPLRKVTEVVKIEEEESSTPLGNITKVPTRKDEDIAEFNPLRKVTEVVKIEEEESSIPLDDSRKIPRAEGEDIAGFNPLRKDTEFTQVEDTESSNPWIARKDISQIGRGDKDEVSPLDDGNMFPSGIYNPEKDSNGKQIAGKIPNVLTPTTNHPPEMGPVVGDIENEIPPFFLKDEAKAITVSNDDPQYNSRIDEYVVDSVQSFGAGNFCIQLATYQNLENINSIINTYAEKYPVQLVKAENIPNGFQVLVGPLNEDEYPIVLERFASWGFDDAFLRSVD